VTGRAGLLLGVVALIAPACEKKGGAKGADASHRVGVQVVEASSGPIDAVVRGALTYARRDGRRLVVYVSASWCEPCERFQAAVRAGALDASFPRLRLLKFDQDRDLDRLAAAGYSGAFIPRFVVPGSDGRGTANRMEGATRAEDSTLASIKPRLQHLLTEADGAPP
jgi:thiol-disulfide isomerase/thioredoxin